MSMLAFAALSARHIAESPDGTTVTGTPSSFIYASSTPGSAGAQNAISISSGGTIVVNGASPGGSGVTTLYKVNKSVFQSNGTNWWGPITVSSTGPTPLTAPQPTIILSNNTLAASSPIGTVVGTISTTTGLANGTIGTGAYTWTYALSGTNATNFQVSGSSLQAAVANLSGTQGPFTVTATPSPAIAGGPFTLPVSVTVSAGVIPYTSTSPTTLALTSGAVSPLGWPVGFFDDFTGTLTKSQIGTWFTGYQNPNSATTGATYNGNPARYAATAQAAWNGYSGTETIANLSMSASNLIMQVTSDRHTSSVNMNFPSPWGIWEWRVKCTTNDNTRSGINMALWMSGSQWPKSGEIDVTETAVGGGPSGGIGATIHCGPSSDTQVRMSTAALPSGTWNDGTYHVYSVIVTPAYVAFYVDGTRMATGSASSYLNNLQTATDPPTGSAAGSIGYLAGSLLGDPANPNTGNSWLVIFGIELWSTGQAATVYPAVMSVDWFRWSKLTPATGGPHV